MIQHVLAVLPVTDIGVARGWYAALFGREPDNNPMDSLIEWQLVDLGWLQVTVDPVRAGSGLTNFAVDDLRRHLAEIGERGIRTGDIAPFTKGELCSVEDPDGNVLTFIDGFQVVYSP